MKILAALDGLDAAFNALRTACNIAVRTHSYITAFYVNKGQEYTPDETGWVSLKEKISDELETLGHEVISKAYKIGKDTGVPVEGVISYGIPALEILKYINAHGIIKLITMGHSSKGRGTQEFVESTTKNIIAQSVRTPVFVSNSEINIGSILIAVDDAEVSKKAAAFGGTLAKSLGANIGVISVIPDTEEMVRQYRKIAEVQNIERYIEDSEKKLIEMARRAIFTAKDILTSMDIGASSMIKKGQPSEEIISEAKNYDLLVVGVKGMHPHKKLSGIANKLLDTHTITTVFVQ